MVNVRLYSKNQDCLTNYIPFQPIIISNSPFKVTDVNFHILTIAEEVKKLSKKERKNYKKQILAFQSAIASFTIFPLTSMANSTTVTVPATTLPNSAEAIPQELMDLMIGILKLFVASGVILAAILIVSAGIVLMVPKIAKIIDVKDWIVHIFRGLMVVLGATPLVFIIYYLSKMLFSSSGWYISPF
jgi:hypothetical protein